MATTEERVIDIDGQEITLSHLDKVLFPDDGILKADLIAYYSRIAPYMIPLVKDRPVSMERFPNGIGAEGFFQKEAPGYFPDFIDRVEIDYKKAEDKWQVCLNNRASLVYLVNQGVITTHIWLSRKDKLNYPDRIVFDLDPSKEKEFNKIIRAAKCMKNLMEEIGLNPYVMTTGSRGLHVTIPILREQSFDEIRKGFAEKVAKILVRRWPDDLTLEVRKANRHDRIFVDTLRNAYAQTAVAPYSVRPLAGAPVATPLSWDELDSSLTPDKYTINNIFRRMGQKEDPWKDIDSRSASMVDAGEVLNEIISAQNIC